MERLIFGLVVFFGVYSISLLALGWRDRVAERLGTRTWQGIYSIAALVGLYLLVAGYGAARASDAVLYATPPEFRYIAALLMLPAFSLALASVIPGRIRTAAQHPLLLATMLWAVAHLLTNGSVADLLLFGTFLVWAVAARHARSALCRVHQRTMELLSLAGLRSTRSSFSGCTPAWSGYRRSAPDMRAQAHRASGSLASAWPQWLCRSCVRDAVARCETAAIARIFGWR